MQTDPNWANFLVDETRAVPRLVLLDFGATRTYSKTFIHDYIQLLQFAAAKDSMAIKSHAVKFGLIDARESPAAFDAFEQTLKASIEPFFGDRGSAEGDRFDFADPQHLLRSQKSVRVLTNELVYTPPPHNLVFLHRKLGGVYSILKSLGVKLDVSGYWQKMLKYSGSSETIKK